MTASKESMEKAAQLWCLPQHGHKVMDVEFAKSIALALDTEREACAKVAESLASDIHNEDIDADGIASAIRSRTERGGDG